MMKRVVLLVVNVLAAVAGGARPNVLFLVVDDLMPKLGCYGESNMVTPNMDNLASRSVVFHRAYIQQALCSPSRTSFLTGRRPDSTRIFDLQTYFRNLGGNYTTLPQHFKNQGYISWSVGKIFHPGVAASDNDDNAYSWTYPAYHAPTEKYNNAKVCPDTDGRLHHYARCPVKLEDMPEKSLPDIQIADTALQFLYNRSQDQQPFFLGVGFHKPHLPFKFPEGYLDLYPLFKIHLAPNPYYPPWLPQVAYSPWDGLRAYEDISRLNLTWPFQPIPLDYQLLLRQSYSAATSYTDFHLGRVLHGLDQYGLTNNTIISFLGDHGWQLGEHNEWCKQTNFDIATRVPMMFHVPGLTSQASAPGQTFPLFDALKNTKTVDRVSYPCDSANCCHEHGLKLSQQSADALVEAVDLYATLSELAGLDLPPICPPNPFNVTFCTEGSSFVPLIRNVTGSVLSGGEEGSRASRKGKLVWKSAVFSQFPRPSNTVQNNSQGPNLNDIRIMGYTMKTDQYRYTEWVAYDPTTFSSNFSHVYARELYIHSNDPDEDVNVADKIAFQDLVLKLSQQLRAGWRNALP